MDVTQADLGAAATANGRAMGSTQTTRRRSALQASAFSRCLLALGLSALLWGLVLWAVQQP
jgi:hypothetical protein